MLFPWMGTFDPADLPQYADIRTALRHAGDLARLYSQRITFHPRWGSGLGVVVAVVMAAVPTQRCAASILRAGAASIATNCRSACPCIRPPACLQPLCEAGHPRQRAGGQVHSGAGGALAGALVGQAACALTTILAAKLMSLCLCLPALLPPALQVLDLMGYEPSPENKINIHVGGWVLLGYIAVCIAARIGKDQHLCWLSALHLLAYLASLPPFAAILQSLQHAWQQGGHDAALGRQLQPPQPRLQGAHDG